MGQVYTQVSGERDAAETRMGKMNDIDIKLRLDIKVNKDKLKKCDATIDVETQREAAALKAAEAAAGQAEEARGALQVSILSPYMLYIY